MKPSWLSFNLVLIVTMFKLVTTTRIDKDERGDFFEKTLLQLMYQRRMFMDGFSNATAILQRGYDFDDAVTSLKATEGEGRGRRKKLRQMNRTLIAIVMAYTLKFMFLIPTFVGTLILLKFTTGLAGFFYALFAAVLGLDHRREH